MFGRSFSFLPPSPSTPADMILDAKPTLQPITSAGEPTERDPLLPGLSAAGPSTSFLSDSGVEAHLHELPPPPYAEAMKRSRTNWKRRFMVVLTGLLVLVVVGLSLWFLRMTKGSEDGGRGGGGSEGGSEQTTSRTAERPEPTESPPTGNKPDQGEKDPNGEIKWGRR